MYFVRYSELLAALSATRSQNTTTVCSRHTLAETMLVVSLAIVGLERSFHFSNIYIISYLFIAIMLRGITTRCKVTQK